MAANRFAALAERLLREGVAPRHVARLVLELRAHFEDLVAEARAGGLSLPESESRAAARLGTDEVLAASILARPELRSWARQRPWLAFVLLPLLFLSLQFVLAMAAAVGVFAFAVRVLGVSRLHPGSLPLICAAIQGYALWLAPLIAAGAVCGYAARLRAPLLWPLLGGVLIALAGAMTNAGFDWSAAVPQGALSGGIGFPGRDPAMGLRLGVNLLAILAALLWSRRVQGDAHRAGQP
jgi:hypothetical protein